MSVLDGYCKYKRYLKKETGYQLCSHWTSSNTVHFDDGKTAQEKLGAINGITDSLTATSSNVALSSKAGNSLQSQIDQLNTHMQAFTSAASITSDYIKEQYIYTQQNGNYVKLTGNITLTKEIPIGNTMIGSIHTPNKPITEMYFCFVTPQGTIYLAFITTNAEIVICNYHDNTISTSVDLYIIGLEWFFD